MLRRSQTSFTFFLLIGAMVLFLISPRVMAQWDDAGKLKAKPRPEYFVPGDASKLVDVKLDSGFIANATESRATIYSEIVEAPGASWMRIQFESIQLGAAPLEGRNTIVRLTSLLDGAVQTMNVLHLRQWHNTSAFFNGNALNVEIIADPEAEPSRIVISQAIIGNQTIGTITKSICGSTDDRILSSDPRTGRGLPAGCTAWMIDGSNTKGLSGSLLSAGHCFRSGNLTVIQFNVPLSNPDSSINHPPPSDQYAIDTNSLQYTLGPNLGNDWAYFGCFPNSTTGLTPLEAQGQTYHLASVAPIANNQTLRINGYGTTSAPISPTLYLVGKVHEGPLSDHLSTTLLYQVDTTGGNSGSSVEMISTGQAIGIHTNGGCSIQPGSTNFGTSIENLALQNALQTPLGVCWPCHSSDIDGNTIIDVFDLLALLGSWGTCGTNCLGDRDQNGMVGVIDLLDLLGLWGECSAGGKGPFVSSPPLNDLCADAIPIADGLTEFDTTWASTDGPSHVSCMTAGDSGVTVNDIWFEYTASCTGWLEVSTCGIASYDTDLVLYSGDCNSLTLKACSDDALVTKFVTCGQAPLHHSLIEGVAVSLGEVFLIRVGGWADLDDDSGPGSLSITCTP